MIDLSSLKVKFSAEDSDYGTCVDISATSEDRRFFLARVSKDDIPNLITTLILSEDGSS
jgi:hypothetical protein